MRPQPRIDWPAFAADMRAHVAAIGSYEAVCAAHPGVNKGMLSRACNARTLSAASFLHLCQRFALMPEAYLRLADPAARGSPQSIADIVRNQRVTACVSRDTYRGDM